jgi:hypothetical protein
MSYQKEREEFIARMVEAFGRDKKRQVELLLRHAKTHGRLEEMSCNGHPAQGDPHMPVERINKLQDRWDAWIEKREGQIERRIQQLCAEIGCKVDMNGDPRGYTIKVFLPDNAYNTWGGAESGWGVPQ